MDLDTALASRRSVRDYTAEPVDEATIRGIIDAAVLAPSATNAQPWTFLVVRDQALLDRLSSEAKAYLLAGGLPDGPGVERRRTRLADPDYQIFHHAPALILISGTASHRWVVEDCSLAAENLMLAAAGLGLGTCWIGYAQRYLETPAGRALVGLPEGILPVAPIVVGHPSVVPAPTDRREPEIRWLG
jgi:nitroreductase